MSQDGSTTLGLLNNQFAVQLVQKVLEKTGKDENFIVQPWAVINQLVSLYYALDTETQKKIDQLIGVEEAIDVGLIMKMTENQGSLIEKLANKLQKERVNKIFVDASVNNSKEFKAGMSLLKKRFNTIVEVVDFQVGDPLRKMSYKIGALPDGVRHPITNPCNRMVIINQSSVCHLSWLRNFKRIEVLRFFARTSTYQTPYLNVQAVFKTAKFKKFDTKFRILQLPYADGVRSMNIIMPKHEDGNLVEIETKILNPNNVEQWINDLDAMTSHLTDVYIPKFEITTTKSMKLVLVKLGLGDLFNPKIGVFDKVTKQKDFCISEYYQHAKISLGTRGQYNPPNKNSRQKMGKSDRPVTFIANRPFLFAIVNNDSKLVEYFGRVCKPARASRQIRILCHFFRKPKYELKLAEPARPDEQPERKKIEESSDHPEAES